MMHRDLEYYVPSLLVIEGGQIEHFDKVTEEEQPTIHRYTYSCNISTANFPQNSKPCGSEQPSNVGDGEQDSEREQGSLDRGQQRAGPAGHHRGQDQAAHARQLGG